MAKKSLSINKIITIRELEEGLYERAIEYYKKTNATIYLLNENEIINERTAEKSKRRRTPSNKA